VHGARGLKTRENDGRIIVSVACAARVRGGQAGIRMASVASPALAACRSPVHRQGSGSIDRVPRRLISGAIID
jgi:hypothetical protein